VSLKSVASIGRDDLLGESLAGSKAKRIIVGVFMVAALAMDMIVAVQDTDGHHWLQWLWLGKLDSVRLGLAVIGVGLFLVLADGDWRSVGLRWAPKQGWRWWGKVALAVMAGIVLVAVVVGGVMMLFGVDVKAFGMFDTPARAWPWFRHACLVAPVLEEMIYRFILCVAAMAILGPVATIIISGIVFAALHFVYGNPCLDNVVAGYGLAWAFLKSRTILVPMALHAAGNLTVGLLFLAACWL
jgi:membrane protease YdiL (CAAX protease family)